MPAPLRISNDSLTLAAPLQKDGPFGIYIHIPFCAHICPYCDFNTFSGQSERIPRYVEAACRETAIWADIFAGRTAGSIFFGGGTPSLLTPGQIGQLLSACRHNFEVAADAEVTIESNPNDVHDRYCQGLLDAGVNRISIGAQTLDRRGLRVLGRLHEADHVSKAVAAARSAGVENLSLDLIFGWPGQTSRQWMNDLEQVLSGAVGGSPPDHLSLYSLIIEPGTPMSDAAHRGILTPLRDDTVADFYDIAIDTLASRGWRHYEISNWSSTEHCASRHNTLYWRNGEYAGIGAGAHGHSGSKRTMNQPSPGRYIETMESGGSPLSNSEHIDDRTAMGETMMLGLRLLEDGVSLDAFQARHGTPLLRQYGPQVSRLLDLGMLHFTDGAVLLSDRGALLANSVCAEFL